MLLTDQEHVTKGNVFQKKKMSAVLDMLSFETPVG